MARGSYCIGAPYSIVCAARTRAVVRTPIETSQLVERWNDFLAVFDSWTQGGLERNRHAQQRILANEMAMILYIDETTLFSGLITSLSNIMFAMFSVMFMSFIAEPALFSNLIMGMTPENKRPAMRRILDRSSELH